MYNLEGDLLLEGVKLFMPARIALDPAISLSVAMRLELRKRPMRACAERFYTKRTTPRGVASMNIIISGKL